VRHAANNIDNKFIKILIGKDRDQLEDIDVDGRTYYEKLS
jgi:hypothetical protein